MTVTIISTSVTTVLKPTSPAKIVISAGAGPQGMPGVQRMKVEAFQGNIGPILPLTQTPLTSDSVLVMYNAIPQIYTASYTITGNVITFTFDLVSDDIVVVQYPY